MNRDKSLGSSSLPPPGQDAVSFLSEETSFMEQARREEEKRGHSSFGKVHHKEHADPTQQSQAGIEEGVQNNIKGHPELQKQTYDGADPDVNVVPALNTTARTEYDNAKREQQHELQMRLGNMPKMGTAPKPNSPS